MKKFIVLLGLSLFLFILEIRICPFFNLFHIPCPSCGLTRAFICLMQGRVLESIRYNILIVPLSIFGLIYILSLFFHKKEAINFILFKNRKVLILLAIILMVVTEIININNKLLY